MEDKNKKPDIFGGFQALTSSLLPEITSGESSEKDDNIEEVDSLEDILEDNIEDEPKKPKKKGSTSSEKDEQEDSEDLEELEDEVGDGKDTKTKVEDESETSDLNEFEPDITKFFQDKLGSELGWDFSEEEKFESVKDLVDYMKGVVEEASKPVYANDEIERLNQFVLNGGKLEDYYSKIKPGGLDPDSLDITKETDAKLAIREQLRIQGNTEDRIKRTIQRYEDSGILEDQGEDAVEFLKEYKESSKKKLLEETQNNAEEAKKQQQKFVSTVQANIKGLDTIRGIKISNKDKADLMDYIFKPDSEGLTKYQRDYMSDVKNLIESAYFTKQGDKLISQAQKTATSDAYKDLHQKLKASKGKIHSGGGNQDRGGSSDSLTSLLGKTLLKQ